MKFISIETTTIDSESEGTPIDIASVDTTTTPSSAEFMPTKQSQPKSKKTKEKKKKRVNRKILSTLLSRKKFYRMLEQKLTM